MTKYYYLLSLFLFISSYGLFAQDDALNELIKWEEQYTLANEIYFEISQSDNPYSNAQDIEKKCKEALTYIDNSLSHCEKSMELSSKYSNDAKIFYIESCMLAGWFNLWPVCQKVFTNQVTSDYINKALDLRTDKSGISYSSLALKKSQGLYNTNYDDLIYLAFINNSNLGNKSVAAKYGKELIESVKANYGTEFINKICNDTSINYIRARVWEVISVLPEYVNDSEKLDYNVMLMEYYAEYYVFEKKNDGDFEFDFMELTDMLYIDIYCASELLSKQSSRYDLMMRMTKAHWKLGNVDIAPGYYAAAVLFNDNTSLLELWDYLRITKEYDLSVSDADNTKTNKENIKTAADRTFAFISLSGIEDDYRRLLEYYQYIDDFGKTNEIKSILSRLEQKRLADERKIKRQQNWGLSVGFAPGKLIWYGKYRQVSVHTDFTTFGYSHGGRFCKYDQYVDYSRFGAWTEEEGSGSFNTYSGYEASYWGNVFFHNDGIFSMRIAIEGRYGHYNFNQINAPVIDRRTNLYESYASYVNPIGHRFDVNLVYRMRLYAVKRVYFEGDFGFGFGYRWLTSDEYDLNNFLIEDIRFNDDRWPKVTMPLRLGIRVGFVLF